MIENSEDFSLMYNYFSLTWKFTIKNIKAQARTAQLNESPTFVVISLLYVCANAEDKMWITFLSMFVEDSSDGFDILASHAVWNHDEANKVK